MNYSKAIKHRKFPLRINTEGVCTTTYKNVFCKEVFETRDEAMDAAFEALEKTV